MSRWLGVFDVGRVINAKTAASQLRGRHRDGDRHGAVGGDAVDPRNGRVMNPGLDDYHVPVHADIPPIDVH